MHGDVKSTVTTDQLHSEDHCGHMNATPRTQLSALVISFVIAGVPIGASAGPWTSPDGFLTINEPDAAKFERITEPQPPFVALWISTDESTTLGVVMTPIPKHQKLIRSSAEEGFAEAIGGPVTRLTTTRLAGHEVWDMAGNSNAGVVRQAMLRHDATLYKVMAVTTGDDPDTSDGDNFVDSLSVEWVPDDSSQEKSWHGSPPLQDLGGGLDSHRLSKTLGGIGLLLGVIVLVYRFWRARKSHRMPSSS